MKPHEIINEFNMTWWLTHMEMILFNMRKTWNVFIDKSISLELEWTDLETRRNNPNY